MAYEESRQDKVRQRFSEEEVKTLRLIFRMYLAGFSPKVIAGVLTFLGRKTKTRKLKSGRVREGRTNRTASDVLRVLKNERACGDVLAQKTYTPNYLDHRADQSVNCLRMLSELATEESRQKSMKRKSSTEYLLKSLDYPVELGGSGIKAAGNRKP